MMQRSRTYEDALKARAWQGDTSAMYELGQLLMEAGTLEECHVGYAYLRRAASFGNMPAFHAVHAINGLTTFYAEEALRRGRFQADRSSLETTPSSTP